MRKSARSWQWARCRPEGPAATPRRRRSRLRGPAGPESCSPQLRSRNGRGVARAICNGRALRIRYRHAGETGWRKLAPLGLVLKAGVWYLVAQKGASFRTYRVSNITEAEVRDEPCLRPKNFDLAAHWAKASRAFEIGAYRERAKIRLSPRSFALLELLGPYVVESAAQTTSPQDRRGWVTHGADRIRGLQHSRVDAVGRRGGDSRPRRAAGTDAANAEEQVRTLRRNRAALRKRQSVLGARLIPGVPPKANS